MPTVTKISQKVECLTGADSKREPLLLDPYGYSWATFNITLLDFDGCFEKAKVSQAAYEFFKKKIGESDAFASISSRQQDENDLAPKAPSSGPNDASASGTHTPTRETGYSQREMKELCPEKFRPIRQSDLLNEETGRPALALKHSPVQKFHLLCQLAHTFKRDPKTKRKNMVMDVVDDQPRVIKTLINMLNAHPKLLPPHVKVNFYQYPDGDNAATKYSSARYFETVISQGEHTFDNKTLLAISLLFCQNYDSRAPLKPEQSVFDQEALDQILKTISDTGSFEPKIILSMRELKRAFSNLIWEKDEGNNTINDFISKIQAFKAIIKEQPVKVQDSLMNCCCPGLNTTSTKVLFNTLLKRLRKHRNDEKAIPEEAIPEEAKPEEVKLEEARSADLLKHFQERMALYTTNECSFKLTKVSGARFKYKIKLEHTSSSGSMTTLDVGELELKYDGSAQFVLPIDNHLNKCPPLSDLMKVWMNEPIDQETRFKAKHRSVILDSIITKMSPEQSRKNFFSLPCNQIPLLQHIDHELWTLYNFMAYGKDYFSKDKHNDKVILDEQTGLFQLTESGKTHLTRLYTIYTRLYTIYTHQPRSTDPSDPPQLDFFIEFTDKFLKELDKRADTTPDLTKRVTEKDTLDASEAIQVAKYIYKKIKEKNLPPDITVVLKLVDHVLKRVRKTPASGSPQRSREIKEALYAEMAIDYETCCQWPRPEHPAFASPHEFILYYDFYLQVIQEISSSMDSPPDKTQVWSCVLELAQENLQNPKLFINTYLLESRVYAAITRSDAAAGSAPTIFSERTNRLKGSSSAQESEMDTAAPTTRPKA